MPEHKNIFDNNGAAPLAASTKSNPWLTALCTLGVVAIIIGVIAFVSGGTAIGIALLALGFMAFVGWLVAAAVTWRG